jgi:cyclopropane-fatty-acyl-phospholipid synthase
MAVDELFRIFFAKSIRSGSIEVETASGRRFVAGDGSGKQVALRFADKAAQILVMLDPELYFGELFMNGRVEMTRGSAFELLMIASDSVMRPTGWERVVQKARMAVRRFGQVNDIARARRNVAHHYDLDAGIYALFLDSDLQYSCAYFEFDGQSLEDAQLAKKRHIAAKLLVEPRQRVLDIGCGFGGMAIYLARVCDAAVTGVTLSKAQLGIAKRRAADLGLSAAVDFRLLDYREIGERFDRIVSVGMFEHVGLPNYEQYFKKIAQMLDGDGIALVHTIGQGHGPAPTNPWISKYIFPGGYIPALSEILPAIERAGLFVTDIEVLRLHYAETLRHWRERFQARRKEVMAIYDDRFCRMWELYLASSEAAFRRQGLVVFQIQLAKKLDAVVPLARDYISRQEADLRRRESSAGSA